MTDPVLIDEAGAAEIPAIMKVMDAAFSPEFGEAWTAGQCQAMLTFPGSHILVARQGGEILGFAFARSVLDEAELLMIAVHPDYGRSGIGRALLQSVICYCRKNGVKRIHLEVREDNEIAKNLYLSDKFLAQGIRKSYYRGVSGKTANSITFSREIA